MRERYGAVERPLSSRVFRMDASPATIRFSATSALLCARSILTGHVSSSSTPRLPAARHSSMNSNIPKTFCVNLNMIFTSLIESVMAIGPGFQDCHPNIRITILSPPMV